MKCETLWFWNMWWTSPPCFSRNVLLTKWCNFSTESTICKFNLFTSEVLISFRVCQEKVLWTKFFGKFVMQFLIFPKWSDEYEYKLSRNFFGTISCGSHVGWDCVRLKGTLIVNDFVMRCFPRAERSIFGARLGAQFVVPQSWILLFANCFLG